MSHGDDIRAIHARNDLTVEEKRARAYEVKGNAYRGIRGQVVDKPWTNGDLTINVTSLDVDDKHRLSVRVTVTRGGVPIVFPRDAQPFIFVNPPLIHAGAEDPMVAFRQILADAVSRYG